MHDATEGGFVAALNELAGASVIGFVVDWDRIPLGKEALALKQHFSLSDEQVLSMSSTGTIIGAVNPDCSRKNRGSAEKKRSFSKLSRCIH